MKEIETSGSEESMSDSNMEDSISDPERRFSGLIEKFFSALEDGSTVKL